MSKKAGPKVTSKQGATRKTEKVGDEIFESLDILHPNAAGIDIGSDTHYVAVADDRDPQPVRTFGCFTPDLEAMAEWLQECRITDVVMESTGVYWIPAYQILSAKGFHVVLVDARHAKNVPGRKSDVWDCRWIRKLHTFGLLRGCFIPDADVQEMRAYCRHRASLIESCSQQSLRMQKALEQMNVQLHKVLSDVMGQTGLRIIRQIIAGERDTEKLAALCDRRVKASRETMIKALTGHYQAQHLFTLRHCLENYDFLHKQIVECDEQISKCLSKFQDKDDKNGKAEDGSSHNSSDSRKPETKKPLYRRKNEPYVDVHSEATRILGVDLTRIDGVSDLTVMVVLSECGPTLASFPSARHFSSWLGLSPNHRITGGRIRSNRTRRVNNRLAHALRVSAQSLHRSQSALGAFLRRIASRHGMPKAITATAHKLACIIYNMITRGQQYVSQGQEDYERQYQERKMRALQKQARALGFSLVTTSTGEVVS
jgi:transposase